tara:strand:- start:13144 stop:14289 length:1146 start_codon:yes stop_codon:yes gene_type:complete
MEIRIRQPNDGGEQWTTTLDVAGRESHNLVRIQPVSQAKDPVHTAIVNTFRTSFKNTGGIKFFYGLPHTNTMTLMIGNTPFFIEKTSRYYINGQLMKLEELCHALARVLFKSCFEKDPAKLMQSLYSTIELPESVKYVIENRVPYYFYDNFTRHDVRLNVQRISDNECAIELGDGQWGNISVKDLDRFCSFYVSNKKTAKKWMYISPQNLYFQLMGKEPRLSDMKVLIAFLKQNRKQRIVEERAQKLVEEMLEQYPNRLKGKVNSQGMFEVLYVKGKKFDWKLENRNSSSATQAVSTYVWQPEREAIYDDEGTTIGNRFVNPNWRGPICIDNMGANTPVGDQFASRALALLNDEFTMQIVSTIKTYIMDNENENRIDWDEM